MSGSGSLPSAAPEVEELTEPLQILDVGAELLYDEIDTALQREEDPYWLPPEIARAPEEKCKADVQVDRLSSTYVKR
jgi:hypothetical protein